VSDQQYKVLGLVAAGYSHAAIARTLGLHVGSVKTYIARLKDKVEVTTAHELRLVHRLCTAGSQFCWMTGDLCPRCPKNAYTKPFVLPAVDAG